MGYYYPNVPVKIVVAAFQDEKARENIQDAIDDVPGDATLEQAAAAIRGQALILATEINQISSINCKRS